MSYTPSADDIEAIEQAAAELDSMAGQLRMSHTKAPEHEDFDDENAAASYREMKANVTKLYNIAERMKGTTVWPGFSDPCRALCRECKSSGRCMKGSAK